MAIPWGDIDWGDFPTWVSAITTLGALIAAGIVVRVELKRDHQAQLLAAEQRSAQARATQADLVAAWHEDDPQVGWTAIVQNNSNLPIYDVTVKFIDRVQALRGAVRERVVPPGRLLLDWPKEWPEEIQEYAYTHIEDRELEDGDPRGFAVSVHFRDTAGRLWSRDQFGVLQAEGLLRAGVVHSEPRPWPRQDAAT